MRPLQDVSVNAGLSCCRLLVWRKARGRRGDELHRHDAGKVLGAPKASRLHAWQFSFFMHGTGVTCGALRGCMPKWRLDNSGMVSCLSASVKHGHEQDWKRGCSMKCCPGTPGLLAGLLWLMPGITTLPDGRHDVLEGLYLCGLVFVRGGGLACWTCLVPQALPASTRFDLVLCGAGLPGHCPGRYGGVPGTDGLPRCGQGRRRHSERVWCH